MMLTRPAALLHWLALLVAALIVAMLFNDGYQRDVLIVAVSFAICAAATDYTSGFAGVRTLGPIIPFALGAYGHGILLERGFSFWTSAALLPCTIALIGALLCLAMVGSRRDVTPWAVFGLAATIALEQVARASTWLTGGSNGILVRRYFGDATLDPAFAILAAAIFAGAMAWLLTRVAGRRGAAILLAHFEPERLLSHGVSLAGLRAVAVMWQWGLSAAAGVLFAAASGTVDPSIFGIRNNLTVLIACTVFGERSILGPALAAFLIVILENTLGSLWSGWQTLLLGAGLILVLVGRNREAAPRSKRESAT